MPDALKYLSNLYVRQYYAAYILICSALLKNKINLFIPAGCKKKQSMHRKTKYLPLHHKKPWFCLELRYKKNQNFMADTAWRRDLIKEYPCLNYKQSRSDLEVIFYWHNGFTAFFWPHLPIYPVYGLLLRRNYQMTRKLIITIMLVVVTLSLIGCGTVQGVGNDINWIGRKGSEIIEGE